MMWFIYAFERCYHFLLLLRTALQSQHSVLLGKKKKLSLIHEQESCRLLKLQWMWIKLGWIMTFKVKQKDLQFICHCWALNEQLNCSYLEHRAFQKQLFGIETTSRLELCASKIFSNYFLCKEWIQAMVAQKAKGLLTAKFNFQHCGKQNKRDPTGIHLSFSDLAEDLFTALNIIWFLSSCYFLHIILSTLTSSAKWYDKIQ